MPMDIAAQIEAMYPNEWNVGRTPKIRSSEERWKNSVQPSMFAERFRCVSMTPLGVPVVPDVNKIAMIESGSILSSPILRISAL